MSGSVEPFSQSPAVPSAPRVKRGGCYRVIVFVFAWFIRQRTMWGLGGNPCQQLGSPLLPGASMARPSGARGLVDGQREAGVEPNHLLHAEAKCGGLGCDSEEGPKSRPCAKALAGPGSLARGGESSGDADSGLESGAVKALGHLENLVISDGKQHVGKHFWEIAGDDDFLSTASRWRGGSENRQALGAYAKSVISLKLAAKTVPGIAPAPQRAPATTASSSAAPFVPVQLHGMPVVETLPMLCSAPPSRFALWCALLHTWVSRHWAALGPYRARVLACIMLVLFSRLLVRLAATVGRLVSYAVRDAVGETFLVVKLEILTVFGSMWDCVKHLEDELIAGLECMIFGNCDTDAENDFSRSQNSPAAAEPTTIRQGTQQAQQPRSGHPPTLWYPFWQGIQFALVSVWTLRKYGEWWWSILAAKAAQMFS